MGPFIPIAFSAPKGRHSRLETDPTHPRPESTDLAVIQYTTGTTGLPKDAMLTHLNLAANAAQARDWVPQIPQGTSVVYAVLSGIQIGISGAMPLAQSLVEPWEKETGGYLVEAYGLSETSPGLTANPVAPSRRAGTVGLPLPNTEIRVVDPENPTADRATGEQGELIVRGPQVFSGCWKKPDETAAVFVDADGFVRIVDRIEGLVKTSGFNVSPSEVEKPLRTYPGSSMQR